MANKKNTPKAPKPRPKPRQESITSTSTFDYASPSSITDNNYSGVDDIDDDDDELDPKDVRAVEGQYILDDPSPLSTPRPEYEDSELGVNDGDNESNGVASPASDNSDVSWQGLPDNEHEFDLDALFEDVTKGAVSGSSESSDSDNENVIIWPDIFVEQNYLDPSFRHRLENPSEVSSISERFWDFEEKAPANGHHSRGPSADLTEEHKDPLEALLESDDDDYSGGETTEDDEDYPEGPIKPPTAPHDADDSDADSEFDAPVRHSNDQPLTTAYSLHGRRLKPMAVWNHKKKKMMIFMPSQPEPAPPTNWLEDVSVPQSPATEYLGWGPVPAPGIDNFGFPVSDFNAADFSAADFNTNWSDAPIPETSSEAASEAALDLDTFIAYDSSDDESQKEPATTPVRPTTAASEADPLAHLHSSNVGAFRQNQVNARLIRNGATQDSIDFSNAYENTVIKGIRSDRFDTAIAPLTPARRHKRQNSDAVHSPLDAVSAKRKASEEAPSAAAAAAAHKKQKSISTELTDLHM